MLTKLIKEMQERGFISISPIRLAGKIKAVCEFMSLMSYTRLWSLDDLKENRN